MVLVGTRQSETRGGGTVRGVNLQTVSTCVCVCLWGYVMFDFVLARCANVAGGWELAVKSKVEHSRWKPTEPSYGSRILFSHGGEVREGTLNKKMDSGSPFLSHPLSCKFYFMSWVRACVFVLLQ